ncbi:uncharacterized protein G2W53_008993 [Senna tora]|uniref:Uncharacterized protein n=1 Tax=Senna tora TaxID=362788 RepID=A0A835C7C0_9FABA|nr:uncharacterized protein G2W53_008993 [Senna tora]
MDDKDMLSRKQQEVESKQMNNEIVMAAAEEPSVVVFTCVTRAGSMTSMLEAPLVGVMTHALKL